jgi:hypothetical protein
VIKKVLLLGAVGKISIFIIIFLAYSLLPFNKISHDINLHFPKNERITMSTAYKTWDAQHYLLLSEKGYIRNFESDRFFPLFPGVIYLINLVFRHSILSGLLMSNIFSLLGLWYFFLFSKLLLKTGRASFKSILFLLCFPSAFFLSLIYSESLLFFLTSAFLFYLYSRKYLLAAFFVFFIPLARPTGILIIFPYLIHWLIIKYKTSPKNHLDFAKNFLLDRKSYYLLSPIGGLILYFLIFQIATGNYLEGLRALQGTVAVNWNLRNALDPFYFLVNLFYPDNISLHGFSGSIVDRVFFIFYCFSLVLIYRKLDKTMFVYALCFGMVPVFGSFMSYTRYVLMVFPMFIVFAKIFEEKKYDYLFYPFLFFMIMLQGLFLIMHALNYWVA